MVLELILIGGVVYYYVRKNKVKYVSLHPTCSDSNLHRRSKLRKAAFLRGEPWVNKDGTITYPPNYPGLPPYTPGAANTNQPAMGDYKRQTPQPMSRSVPIETPEQYRDEKAPLVVETREMVNEKV